jgi:hypothetical protein
MNMRDYTTLYLIRQIKVKDQCKKKKKKSSNDDLQNNTEN